jgi:hypothetical protein
MSGQIQLLAVIPIAGKNTPKHFSQLILSAATANAKVVQHSQLLLTTLFPFLPLASLIPTST